MCIFKINNDRSHKCGIPLQAAYGSQMKESVCLKRKKKQWAELNKVEYFERRSKVMKPAYHR